MASPQEYSPKTSGSVHVSQPASAAHRREALQLALRSVQSPAHERLVESLLGERGESDPLASLLEVRVSGVLQGACWLQELPGHTATFWPPELVENSQLGTVICRALVQSALAAARRHEVALVQTLVASPEQAEPLLAEGFEQLAELVYLMSPASSFPTAPPSGPLAFEAYEESRQDRLSHVLEQTYEQTLDCPQLNGLRSPDDVLDGYRLAGSYKPAQWLIARDGVRDVGCLLFTEHPADRLGEVIYMGVVPSARGRGLGQALIRHAQWLAFQCQATALVLAVDARNAPALSAYGAANMVEWDRRWALGFRPSAGQ